MKPKAKQNLLEYLEFERSASRLRTKVLLSDDELTYLVGLVGADVFGEEKSK